MLSDTPEAHQVIKRVLDYCAEGSPWPRRLWRIGTILELRELAEAWGAKHDGALSDASVRYLSGGLLNRVKRDLGMGPMTSKGPILKYLAKPWAPGGHDLEAAHMLTLEASRTYLDNWATAVRQGPYEVEPVARAVASHLLDFGFSPTALHRWFTYYRKYAPTAMTLGDLLEEAAALTRRPQIQFQIVIPLVAAPPMGTADDQYWLSARATAEWLRYWHPGHASLRQVGGVLLNVTSRDLDSAITSARATAERLSARFRVGTRRRLQFHPEMFILSEPAPAALVGRPRRVEVHALERSSAVFTLKLPAYIDAALELLEPLDLGAPAAAVAGSWAAIESLLVGPGDTTERVVAATRMARLVACRYLRAEFTALANAHATNSDDDCALKLRSLPENKDRALHMEIQFRAKTEPTFVRHGHQAASVRMRQAIDDPFETLPRIVGQLEDSFRRLYRQRNLVVHAGLTSSVALEGCLRTTATLIGAGIDRVVHASAAHGVPPLALAAMADVRIEQARNGRTGLAELLP